MAGRRYVKELREHAFAITLMDGRSSVARIGVNGLVEGGVMMVRRIDVVPGSRRQRIGTSLYERAAKVACKEYGIPLASDTSRSAMADGFWKKQEAKGRAVRINDRYVLTCPSPASLAAPPFLEPMIQAKERELVKWKQERGVLFDKHGRVVLQKKGTKHRLSFDEDDLRLFPDWYLTHNHPGETFKKGDREFTSGGSLSPADVAVAAKHNLAEVRAVTTMTIDGHPKTVVYRIERPEGGWPESWRIRDDAEAASMRLKRSIEREYREGKRSYENTATVVMHETWLEVAPKLGLKYDWAVLDGAGLGAAAPRRLRAYHGTSCKNAEAIKQHGMTVNTNPMMSARWWTLAKDKVSSSFHAPEDGCLVEFEIPVSDLPARKWPGWPWLWPAHGMEWEGKSTDWFALREPIPAAFVKRVMPALRRRRRVVR